VSIARRKQCGKARGRNLQINESLGVPQTSSSGQRAGGPLTGVTARGGRFQIFRWQELLDSPPMENPAGMPQEVNAVRLCSLLLSLSLSLSATVV